MSVEDSDSTQSHPDGLPPANPLTPFLQLLSEYRTLQCLACGRCYVKKNYRRHLTRTHHLSALSHPAVFQWVEQQDLADHEAEVPLPSIGSHPISGLPELDGFACPSVACDFLTCSEEVFSRHCSKEHGQRLGGIIDDTHKVILQTFFAKFPRYFQVANLIPAITTSTFNIINTSAARRDLDSRYQLSLHHVSADIRVREAQHISEITPWLRVTGLHVHKQAFGDIDDFRDVLRLPRRDNDLSLSLVCESVDRLLRRGLDRVRHDGAGKRLHRLDAQHLNSFQAGVISQDPFQRLDREHSIRSYSSVFQQLVCYFFRVEDDHFGHVIFTVTDFQRQSSTDVLEEALRQAQALETEDHQVELAAAYGMTTDDDDDERDGATSDEEIRGHTRMRRGQIQASRRELATKQDEQRLDQLTLTFCRSLIQHRLDDCSFDSAMLSFCAVLAWDSSRQAWRKDVGNYSSYLSQLIYVCQLYILLHCDNVVKAGQHATLQEAIVAQRDLWLQNTSRGPVGDRQAWRLYARGIARDTVGIAQIRWHQDGLTLAYRDITYKVSYLPEYAAITFTEREWKVPYKILPSLLAWHST